MVLNDGATLLVECLDNRIEIAIRADGFNESTINISEINNRFNQLTSSLAKAHKNFPGAAEYSTENRIEFSDEGKVTLSARDLIVGCFLITISTSVISKMDEGFLKDVLLISSGIAPIVLSEVEKLAREEEKKRLNVCKRIEITRENHENVIINLDGNNKEEINECIKIIRVLNEGHDKE